MDIEEHECKVVVVGNTQCGKTALVHQFIDQKFSEIYTPTGFERYATTLETEEYRIQLNVWDTSGALGYDQVRALAYPDANAFIIAFEISQPDSLHDVESKWYPEIRRHCPQVPIVLAGCKTDLRNDITIISELAKVRKITCTYEQGILMAKATGAAMYIETSAKTSYKSVKDAFEVAALAAMGKLRKSHKLLKRQRSLEKYSKVKSKLDIKDELRDRAKSCVVM